MDADEIAFVADVRIVNDRVERYFLMQVRNRRYHALGPMQMSKQW